MSGTVADGGQPARASLRRGAALEADEDLADDLRAVATGIISPLFAAIDHDAMGLTPVGVLHLPGFDDQTTAGNARGHYRIALLTAVHGIQPSGNIASGVAEVRKTGNQESIDSRAAEPRALYLEPEHRFSQRGSASRQDKTWGVELVNRS